MLRFSLMIASIICIALAGGVYAQEGSSKSTALAAALDKTKYKKKEKANILIELYIDIKNEPAAKANASEYSGIYEDESFELNLKVERSGAAAGNGYDTFFDRNARRPYMLKGARVEGAVLTAAKVYDDGETVPFEAVFVNRTVSNGTNPQNVASRDTSFGIGWIQRSKMSGGDDWTNRVFLPRR